jgi:flavin reductase (DIM6/NTAB) family NADH-FMN oxidoreductase RutF
MTYGMYIISSYKADKINAQIANTVFQITSEPVTIAISINKKNLTHEFIEASRGFTVSVLNEEAPLQFIGKFGFKTGRNEDKFKDIDFKKLPSGCPVILDHSICYIEAKVVDCFGCGTHTLFIGQMTGSGMLNPGKPMTYEYYHLVKKGTTPRSAPTFIKGE